jgi:FMN reductase
VGVPLVVGIGGSARVGSTTERVLRLALEEAEQAGARTHCLGGEALARLPFYAPDARERTDEADALVRCVREADGVIIASPGYHGGVSGLVKNALDFLEDLRDDERCYLDGRAVGCVATAFGSQACASTLASLRTSVHALRGWPTPLGVTLNAAEDVFASGGECQDAKLTAQLALLAHQVVDFAVAHHPVAALP